MAAANAPRHEVEGHGQVKKFIGHGREGEVHQILPAAHKFYDRMSDDPELTLRCHGSSLGLCLDHLRARLSLAWLTTNQIDGQPEDATKIIRKHSSIQNWSQQEHLEIQRAAMDSPTVHVELLPRFNEAPDFYERADAGKNIGAVAFSFTPDVVYVETLENFRISLTLRTIMLDGAYLKFSSTSFGPFRRAWRYLCYGRWPRKLLTSSELLDYDLVGFPSARRDWPSIGIALFGQNPLPYQDRTEWERNKSVDRFLGTGIENEIVIATRKETQIRLRPRLAALMQTTDTYSDLWIGRMTVIMWSAFMLQGWRLFDPDRIHDPARLQLEQMDRDEIPFGIGVYLRTLGLKMFSADATEKIKTRPWWTTEATKRHEEQVEDFASDAGAGNGFDATDTIQDLFLVVQEAEEDINNREENLWTARLRSRRSSGATQEFAAANLRESSEGTTSEGNTTAETGSDWAAQELEARSTQSSSSEEQPPAKKAAPSGSILGSLGPKKK